MIRFITLTISVVLLTGLTIGMAKSNKQQEPSTNKTTPACPYFIGQPETTQESEQVSGFSHCKKCDTGVYLPHENHVVKGTFCGDLE